ncbi:MAG: quinohemoprotein amine dehydrogenase subunit alpha [Acidobacteriaceae bacterium]
MFSHAKSRFRRCLSVVFLYALIPLTPILGQKSFQDSHGATGSVKQDKGFPIKNELVVSKCGMCHMQDAQGNLDRISYMRATPEAWEEAIKRMVRLNGLQLTPDEGRKILRYLADNQGLAPEEAAVVENYNEYRMVDETDIPNPEVAHACASCHEFARPLSWRRSPNDWKYLVNMHTAFFPDSTPSAFYRYEGPPAPGATPHEQPLDVALAYIKKSTPLMTPEWSNWESRVETPNLAGVWLVSGNQLGKGKFFGEVKIASDPSIAGFSTTTKITYVDGEKLSETGRAIVYTGYAWRGSSSSSSTETGVDAPSKIREVMMLSKNQNVMAGRWFWGAYHEFGMNVTLHRLSGAPALMGVDVWSLKAGSTNSTVHIYGADLPKSLQVSDINLGSGVTVTKIVSATPDVVTVTASVDPAAIPGERLISLKGTTLPAAYTVYDHIDYLKVLPETPLAHLGSQPHPKGYSQFEAVGYSNGPDGKPNTADDIKVGPVPASWKMEEFVSSYGDDDVDFVGKLDPVTGFFTPASDGPDPKRVSMRNNYGDVWVVGTYKPKGAEKALEGRSYMVVTVPAYVQWDESEVAQ